jgi:hypothetical protein
MAERKTDRREPWIASLIGVAAVGLALAFGIVSPRLSRSPSPCAAPGHAGAAAGAPCDSSTAGIEPVPRAPTAAAPRVR